MNREAIIIVAILTFIIEISSFTLLSNVFGNKLSYMPVRLAEVSFLLINKRVASVRGSACIPGTYKV